MTTIDKWAAQSGLDNGAMEQYVEQERREDKTNVESPSHSQDSLVCHLSDPLSLLHLTTNKHGHWTKPSLNVFNLEGRPVYLYNFNPIKISSNGKVNIIIYYRYFIGPTI